MPFTLNDRLPTTHGPDRRPVVARSTFGRLRERDDNARFATEVEWKVVLKSCISTYDLTAPWFTHGTFGRTTIPKPLFPHRGHYGG